MKITKEIKSKIFKLAHKSKKAFGEALKDAWAVYLTAIDVFNDRKCKVSFDVALTRATLAIEVKKGLYEAALNKSSFFFGYMKSDGKTERLASGTAITANNYTFKTNGSKKKNRSNIVYFDNTKQAIRSFKVQNLLYASI